MARTIKIRAGALFTAGAMALAVAGAVAGMASPSFAKPDDGGERGERARPQQQQQQQQARPVPQQRPQIRGNDGGRGQPQVRPQQQVRPVDGRQGQGGRPQIVRPDNGRPQQQGQPGGWSGNRPANDARPAQDNPRGNDRGGVVIHGVDRDIHVPARGNDNRGRDNNGRDNRGNDNRGRDNNGRDNDGRWNNGRDNDGRWNNGNRGPDRGSNWQGNNDRRGDNSSWRGNGNGQNRNWDRNGWRRDNRYDWQSYRDRNRSAYRIGRYYSPYQNYSYRRLGIGFSLGSMFYGNRYWINDPWQYRLPEVYGPYRWVRYYDDVLLVDTYSGQVVDVIYDFFW